MKLLTILLFALCPLLSAFAADPLVIVHSATRVTVDNVEYGKPIDAIANNAQLAPAIQRALEKWAAAHEAERDAAKAALTAKQQRIQEVLGSRLSREEKTGEGPRVKLLRELITEAETPERVLKRQVLEAEIAAKKKELDTMK
jgi:hypothetical protein